MRLRHGMMAERAHNLRRPIGAIVGVSLFTLRLRPRRRVARFGGVVRQQVSSSVELGVAARRLSI